MRSWRAAMAAVVALASASCELSPRLYLTVRTEAGSRVRHVKVRVFSPSGAEVAIGGGTVDWDISPSRPLEMGLRAGVGGERVRVIVEGTDGSSALPVARQEWVTSMPSQGAGYLQIVLWNICETVDCPGNSTCSSAGTCVDNVVITDPKGGSDGGAGFCPEASTGSCQSVADATLRDAGGDEEVGMDVAATDVPPMDVPPIDVPRMDAGSGDAPRDDGSTIVDVGNDTRDVGTLTDARDAGSPTDAHDAGFPTDVPVDVPVDAPPTCPAWSSTPMAGWTSCGGGGSCPTLCGAGSACIQVERLSLGRDHGCALRSDGEVSCWGDHQVGRLGDGTVDAGPTAIPVRVVRAFSGSALESVAALGAGYDGTCAVDRAGELTCWGSLNADPLDTEFNPGYSATPALRLMRADAGAANVFSGVGTHVALTCAIVRGTGGVRCSSWVRFLPDGTDEVIVSPRDYLVFDVVRSDTATPLTGAVEVGVGIYHACARLADGTIWCWGSNHYGQLGVPTLGDGGGLGSSLPAQRVAGLTGVTSFGIGDFFGCALSPVGVRCWGNGSLGRVGGYRGVVDCPNGNVCTPVPVAVEGLDEIVRAAGSPVEQVTAGAEQACVRLRGGQVWCWGHNDVGQIGLPTTGSGMVGDRGGVMGPAVFLGADDVVTSGGGGGQARSWTCARRRSDCTWWCWGRIPGETSPPADLGTPRLLRWGP